MTQITAIDPAKLKPYENNSNKHSRSQVAEIAKSIQEFGFNSPIVVDENNQIKAGHGRWEAAKLLKLKTVPVIQRSGLTESQWKAYVIADNKLTRNSTWDEDMLSREMQSLLDDGFDLSVTGFSGQEINDILITDVEPQHKGNPDRVPEPKPDEDPVSQPGQVWQLGHHRVMCGDAGIYTNVETLMGDDRARMLWTETPHNADGDENTGKGIEADTLTSEIFLSYIVAILNNCRNALFKGASFYVAHQPWHTHTIFEALKRCELPVKQQLVCIKDRVSPGRQDYRWQHELIAYGWKPGAKHQWNALLDHSTVTEPETKPFDKMSKKELVEMLQDQQQTSTVVRVPIGQKLSKKRSADVTTIRSHIENSTKPNDIVIDFCAGTGATLIAADLAMRRCYAMEYDPAMVDIILARWRDFTQQEPILICG